MRYCRLRALLITANCQDGAFEQHHIARPAASRFKAFPCKRFIDFASDPSRSRQKVLRGHSTEAAASASNSAPALWALCPVPVISSNRKGRSWSQGSGTLHAATSLTSPTVRSSNLADLAPCAPNLQLRRTATTPSGTQEHSSKQHQNCLLHVEVPAANSTHG